MELTKIKEIEQAINALTAKEREELYARLDQSYVAAFDRHIETDLASGRLDGAIQRALEEERNGRTRSL